MGKFSFFTESSSMSKNPSRKPFKIPEKDRPQEASFRSFHLRTARAWRRRDTKILVLMGLFTALGIVLTRIVRPIELPFIRVSFGFLATAFASMLLGPLLSGGAAAISDVAGYFLFPSGSMFFPGFTFSAFFTGVIYAIFLYQKPKSVFRIALAVLTVSLFVDLGLNTLWLSILYDEAWTVFFVSRLIKTAAMAPVQILLIRLMWKYIGQRVESFVK